MHQVSSYSRKITRLFVAIAALSTGIVAQPMYALAHNGGGALRANNQPVGTSSLSVWVSPAIPRTGEIHVETLVTNDSLTPDHGHRILVKVTPLNGEQEPQRMMAVPRSVNTASGIKQTERQAVSFHLDHSGDYQIEITVLTADHQGGRHSFDIQVIAVNFWVKFAMQGMLMVALSCGIWLIWNGYRLLIKQSSKVNGHDLNEISLAER